MKSIEDMYLEDIASIELDKVRRGYPTDAEIELMYLIDKEERLTNNKHKSDNEEETE